MTNGLPSSIRLKVISPQKLLVDEEVKKVSLPSLDGYLGILPGHRPIFLSLAEGEIAYSLDGKKLSLPIQGGYAEVLPDKVLVFVGLIKDEDEQPAEGQG